jgi:RNA-directed DNA polymerase
MNAGRTFDRDILMVNTLEPLYERRFIHDSYACRKGKGTHRAVRRAVHYLRRHKYCLKTDVVRFFPNVDHEVLFQLLTKSIRDKQVTWLIEKIITSGEGVLSQEATQLYFTGDDLFSVLRPKGLPIGNLTSQFFANILLDPVDHFVKEELRVPGYVRYADDLILFGDDKSQLWDVCEALKECLATSRLKLHPHKTLVRPSAAGVKFLGFVLRPSEIRLQQEGLKRFNRRLRYLKWAYRNRLIDADAMVASLTAWVAHAQHANSTGIRQEMWRRVKFQRAALRP